MKRLRINFCDDFDYATSARESTMEFADGEITAKEWIDTICEKPSKIKAKRLIREIGVKQARTRLRRIITNYYGGREWSDR